MTPLFRFLLYKIAGELIYPDVPGGWRAALEKKATVAEKGFL